MQAEWNIPLQTATVKPSLIEHDGLFYDFDTKQVNSEEIHEMLLHESEQLPLISGDNLFSLSDINLPQENNMTDSIDKLARCTLENFYQDGKTKRN